MNNQTILQHKLNESLGKYKGNTAIECGSKILSYTELDRRSNYIANWILNKGFEKETFIGTFINDRAELITTILGILKAGCVFVPLDSAHPIGRLEVMINVTDIGFVITDEPGFDAFSSAGITGRPDVEFARFDDLFSDQESLWFEQRPDVHYTPEDKVYIYFTSGTTGIPKAVVGRNKGLLHFIDWEVKTFCIDDTFRFSQFTNPGFDVILRDIFVPLRVGAAICVPESREILLSNQQLVKWIDERGINLIHCVPSLFSIFNRNAARERNFKSLKYILFAGEKVNPAELKKWYNIFDEQIQLVNLYGPTETTLAKVFHRIKKADADKKIIPVGQPINGARVIILDNNMDICDNLEVGELYIRTPYRSLGYYNQPELNKQKFLRNPFSNNPDDIIYKTGDLGRFLPDGNIELIGRVDRQVKIRGMRIELEGIESVLIKHPAVKEAVVVKKVTSNVDGVLYAYITGCEKKPGTGKEEPEIPGIKEYLSQQLPSYMVPAKIIKIEEMPRNPNGKIDFKKLPEPAEDEEAGYIPPRDAVETRLLKLWCDVLKMKKGKIGVTKSFFQAGGTSLNIMSLITKIYREFSVRISLVQMFNNPTIETQGEVIRKAKREHFTTLESVEEKDYYALSSAQRRLYFLQQMEPGNTSYNISNVVLLEGRLEPPLFEKIFLRLIERQESLRISFALVDDEPVQRIHHMDEVEFAIKNDAVECSARQGEIEKIIWNFIQPFDLSQAPLFRVGLISKAQNQNILVIDMHHIISDGTSVEILVKDFMALYGGEELTPLRISYRDYLEWQNAGKKSNSMLKQEKYWLEQFNAGIPKLELPTDHVRPVIQSFAGGSAAFEISPKDTAAINVLAFREGVTLYMVLLAIYNVFLSKVSNQEVIIVGTPVSGRSHVDLEPIIGMFVNTLALINHPEAGKTFLDFLNEVREKTLTAFENQEYLFEDLVDKLVLNRDWSRNPLFDTLFVLQNLNVKDIKIPSLELKHFQYETRTSKFDLTLDAMIWVDRLLLTFEYSTKLFEKKTIERFVSLFKQMTSSILCDPGKRISDIELVPEEERKKLLVEFNDTAFDYPGQRTINELFAEQVEKNPSGTAVLSMDGIGSTSYRQLNDKANQLARCLREKGIGADSVVGLMVERSLEMIIAIISILKAGGAYLPVAPNYPPGRIKFMLEDFGTDILLTRSRFMGKIEFAGTVIDLEDKETYHQDNRNLPPLNGPGNLAYVIYTSGSTGKPKGVMLEHRSIVNRLNWMQRAYPLDKHDTILHKTPFTFDVSVWELLWWPITGAKVCLLVPGGEKEPEIIAHTLEKNNVTVIHFVPSMLNAFLDYLENSPDNIERLTGLKRVIASGETLTPSQVKKFNELLYQSNGTRLSNLYGPTEAAVDVSYFDCPVGGVVEKVPIGKPIHNTRLVVLTRENRLQPVGISGELCIAGAGLARGYLNRPELTRKKFTANPFTPGEVMYRTGDLAKWLPEGNLEFIGRIDHQVKIRGFRIEPGEIENRLLEICGIKEAVVALRKNQNEDAYLCAYIVPEGDLSVPGSRPRLVESLGRVLPGYMIPAYFVEMEEMPLTANGKIDRRVLPEPQADIEEYIAPSIPLEEEMAGIWRNVLDLEKVGVRDNFFTIGGDSIKAIKLISSMNTKLNKNLLVSDLYNYRTIEGLAKRIEQDDNHQTKDELGETRQEIERLKNEILPHLKHPEEIEDLYPMSDIEKGMIFYALAEPGSAMYHDQFIYQPKYPDFSAMLLKRALDLMVVKHPALRSAFILEDFEEPLKVIYKHVDFDIVQFDISGLEKSCQEDHIKKFMAKDRQIPFNVRVPPLFRMIIFTLGSGNICVLWIFHHAILDGWSVASLMTELNNTYMQLKSDPGFIPGKLKSTYKDFIIEQVAQKKKEEIADFWRKELDDYKRLDFSGLNTSEEPGKIKKKQYHLGMDIRAKLEDTAKKYNCSIKNLCLSAYLYMLGMLSYDNDVTAGLITHTRSMKEDGDKVLGCFLNTIPIRVKIPPRTVCVDFIGMVEKKVIQLKEYERTSFFEILRMIDERTLDQNPLFDTFFNFVDFHVYKEALGTDIPDDGSGLSLDIYENTNTLFDFSITTTMGIFLLTLTYSDSLISDRVVERLCSYFKTALNMFACEPEGLLEKSKLMRQEEKKEILYEFNNTRRGYPEDKTLQRLFTGQVEKTPGNTALIGIESAAGARRSLTYKQLNERSDQMARLLMEKGVQHNCIVGIVAERSIEMMVGIFAVLKAGAAYLPIDPVYPLSRIKYVIDDSASRLLLTQKRFAADLKGICEIIDLEGDNRPGNESPEPFENQSSDIAYVIYTSGSTGKPKGVMVEHRSVVNRLNWMQHFYPIGEEDVILQKTSISFDVSVWELFWWSFQGASLCLLGPGEEKNPEGIKDTIVKNKVTTMHFVPSMLNTFLEYMEESENFNLNELASLRQVFSSGEALKRNQVARFNKLLNETNGTELINLYGPTEATVDVSYFNCSQADQLANIPIGKPIDNIHLYIVDKYTELQAGGSPGELCIAGVGVARGYLNQAELTADKFVECPFIPGDRMYKTGDLARWQPDGNIDFLDRMDSQVKIRGYRIELGEIEAQLLKHEGIKNAFLLVKEKNESHIYAYFTSDRELEVPELKAYLSTKLPQYMIPAYFIKIDQIPLTPNGKVDRKVLDSYDTEHQAGIRYVAPENEMEKQIADIWHKVLRIDNVGVYDNFFDIGGHSLSIIKVNSELKKVFNKDISIAAMFRYPTISSLVEYFSGDETGGFISGTRERIEESVEMMDEATDVLFADEID